VKQLKDFAPELEKFRTATITRSVDLHRDRSLDSPGARSQDENPVAHIGGPIDIVGDEEHRGETSLPETQHFILHAVAGNVTRE
jgi:hypothetical protein